MQTCTVCSLPKQTHFECASATRVEASTSSTSSSCCPGVGQKFAQKFPPLSHIQRPAPTAIGPPAALTVRRGGTSTQPSNPCSTCANVQLSTSTPAIYLLIYGTSTEKGGCRLFRQGLERTGHTAAITRTEIRITSEPHGVLGAQFCCSGTGGYHPGGAWDIQCARKVAQPGLSHHSGSATNKVFLLRAGSCPVCCFSPSGSEPADKLTRYLPLRLGC